MVNRFPNILVIGQQHSDMVFDQLHIGLNRLADVRTIWDEHVELFSVKKGMSLLVKPLKLFQMKMYVEPDLIFVMESFRQIQGLENFRCPKAYYIQDAHISVERYKNLSHLGDYDFVFCRQKDYLKDFKGSIWLPESFDPDVILGKEAERDIPITFIGHKNSSPERAEMVKMLEEKFGLQNPFAYNHEMARYLRRSKIVFNHTRNGDLNNRVFDALGSGALLVTQRIGNGLFDLFEDEKHLVTYNGIGELEGDIRTFLQDDAWRTSIAEAGQREAIAKHTNLDRAKTVLETCLGKNEAVEERWRYLKEKLL